MTQTDNQKQEFHIEIITDDKTAVDYLADASGLSRQKIKTVMQQGCVWLEQKKQPVSRLRRAKKRVTTGNVLHFYYDETILQQSPQSASLISDEGDYSVWNKPSGMFSQGSKWGDHCTIQRWAEKTLVPERVAFVVHRLDRAANGLIILAHKKKVAAQFGRMFEQRQITKVYQVLVEGRFADVAENGSITIDDELDGKKSISHVTVLSFDENANRTLLAVNIETGRKHQIRKHLSGLGFPVVGDRLYGSATNPASKSDSDTDILNSNDKEPEDLQLSAVRLSFICPISQAEKTFEL
ncbi:RNA pseudouridine synthase [Cocleimonas sp. KMM 6892]|uniref:RluA family pseudouridine synthase n=1 Tax=unclassified Cocleimonas TaxID=2639732 RepID=UPI002DB82827|nr:MULTISPECIES: RNA pseudouridine synthase [unclassified Cocleimonas]MEB8430736.1 RNA pseudouridine synthase [Cocleimonas sp. KMM 6892]MEC4714492.1 RNA pseudouridine synthase [Cocleimonas sp. KMM 6895]MEC4743825.1 RNA pseudouridine synthase [Cocleimonas sp. KMM 6896]